MNQPSVFISSVSPEFRQTGSRGQVAFQPKYTNDQQQEGHKMTRRNFIKSGAIGLAATRIDTSRASPESRVA
jgi:hypothetical protein